MLDPSVGREKLTLSHKEQPSGDEEEEAATSLDCFYSLDMPVVKVQTVASPLPA